MSAMSLEMDPDAFAHAASNTDETDQAWRPRFVKVFQNDYRPTKLKPQRAADGTASSDSGQDYDRVRENGYLGPKHENEQDRLNKQHTIYKHALDGRLFLSPIQPDELHDVLDVGTGTGIWAIDMAYTHPSAKVLGVDINAMHPEQGAPPNCAFEVADVNADWDFSTTFDLIHSRLLFYAVKDWSRYLRQAYNALKPGAWIEVHELIFPAGHTGEDGKEKPLFVQWSEHIINAAPKVNLDVQGIRDLENLLHDAGFRNVTIENQHWPLGTRAKGERNKEIGARWAEDMKHAARNSEAVFTKVLGWTPEEFEGFAEAIAREVDQGRSCVWTEMCFAYAQKPQKS